MNPQGLPRWILSPVRMPFSPLSRRYWHLVCGPRCFPEIADCNHICNHFGLLSAQIKFLLHGGRSQILVVDNVVPLEDRSCLVPAYHHGNPLGDRGPDHVSNCRSPEVMEKAVSDLCLGACSIPGTPEILDTIFSRFVCEDERGKCAALFSVFPLDRKDFLQF